jgi:hypothetical protein
MRRTKTVRSCVFCGSSGAGAASAIVRGAKDSRAACYCNASFQLYCSFGMGCQCAFEAAFESCRCSMYSCSAVQPYLYCSVICKFRSSISICFPPDEIRGHSSGCVRRIPWQQQGAAAVPRLRYEKEGR